MAIKSGRYYKHQLPPLFSGKAQQISDPLGHHLLVAVQCRTLEGQETL